MVRLSAGFGAMFSGFGAWLLLRALFTVLDPR